MASVQDPVCGMQVDPARAAATTVHQDQTYYFCHPGCLTKFKADPARYLSGGLKLSMHESGPVPNEPAPPGTEYICPMDPEVLSDRPGPCPKCGMPLEPRLALPDEGPDPEARDMARRFWIGLALGLP